jgi:hypothetical protein
MFVPRGTAHTFQNVGTSGGVLLIGVTPGGFEKSFEERQGADEATLRALAKKYNIQVGDRRSSELESLPRSVALGRDRSR